MLLTFEQEIALAQRMRGDDVAVPPPGDPFPSAQEAKNRLVASNVRLVLSVARKYAGRGVDMEDLVQEGLSGLIHAASKFKPDKGFRFSTYVTWWIRQTVQRALQNQSHTMRVPVHVGARIRNMVKAEGELITDLERMPTPEEIAAYAGMEVDDVFALRRARAHPISLDEPLRNVDVDDTAPALVDTIPDTSVDVEEDAWTNDASDGVRFALSFISPRERTILALRFGMGQDHKFSLQEAGQVIGVTRERARQLEVAGMARLKQDKLLMRIFAAHSGE